MRVAYLVNSYPRPSHSFIRREIQALERRGLAIHRFAMRGDHASLVDPADLAEHDLTEHVLAHGPRRLLVRALLELVRSPSRWWRTLCLAIAVGRRAERGVLPHLVYLVEACWIMARCRDLGITHLHAHFGTNSACVAMLVHCLGGPDYSFTVHGPEEFDSPMALSLGEKIRRAAFTVAISSYGRSQLFRWAAPGDWSRIKVVHCGIEPDKFPMVPALPEGKELRLVAIGRLVEQKGQLLLIDAMAAVARSRTPVHLVLIGDGEMRPLIEAAIRTHALEDRVTITGWLDEAGVREEIAAAHALVMPSFAEGLPMVIMEAMASGRAVLATSIAGVPELVLPGENGWLVPAGEVGDLARAILTIAATPAHQLTLMGQSARHRVLLRHDIDTEAGRLARLFEQSPRIGNGD